MVALIFILLSVHEQDLRKRQDYLLFGAGEMYLDRYHITGAMYKSATSEVLHAKDTLGRGNPLVALKICNDTDRFQRQLHVQEALGLVSSVYVMSLLRTHTAEETGGQEVPATLIPEAAV